MSGFTEQWRPADFSGPTSRAWRVSHDRGARTAPDHEAGIATWLLTGPFHPAWSWWFISVVHLRPIEGVRPAHKQYPEAEYELMILSLNPDHPIELEALETGADHARFLTPADLVYQFHGVTDSEAAAIGESVIRAIVFGGMSPDSDFRSSWIHSLDATVAHYRAGGHTAEAGR